MKDGAGFGLAVAMSSAFPDWEERWRSDSPSVHLGENLTRVQN